MIVCEGICCEYRSHKAILIQHFNNMRWKKGKYPREINPSATQHSDHFIACHRKLTWYDYGLIAYSSLLQSCRSLPGSYCLFSIADKSAMHCDCTQMQPYRECACPVLDPRGACAVLSLPPAPRMTLAYLHTHHTLTLAHTTPYMATEILSCEIPLTKLIVAYIIIQNINIRSL